MALAISVLLIPSAFIASLGSTAVTEDAILQISRGTAVILLAVYGMYSSHHHIKLTDRYLYFQLKSHAHLYDEVIAEDAEIEHATIPPWWAFGLSLPS